jgi:hypothetical protein
VFANGRDLFGVDEHIFRAELYSIKLLLNKVLTNQNLGIIMKSLISKTVEKEE